MNGVLATVGRCRITPWAVASLCAFCAAGYLTLVNLDYAGLWYDEAPTAILGNTLLEHGTLSGWDGRNLIGADNGRELNRNLINTWPPLPPALNAIGIRIFGFNEVGVRIMHALVGLLSLVLLYLLLLEHLRKHPRLVFFVFLFSAMSAQLLLYFRQSRYYAFMVFGVIGAFYFYERYWRTGKTLFLVLLTLVAAAAFFNHYVGGAATILSVAAWHMLFRARHTSARQYLRFGLGIVIVAGMGAGYLAWLGVLGGAGGGWRDFLQMPAHLHDGAVPAPLVRVWRWARDLLAADWIAWPVCLWFAGVLLLAWRKRVASRRTNDPCALEAGEAGGGAGDLLLGDVGKVVSMGLLFAVFSGLLAVQPVWDRPVPELRYFVGALPLLLAMKGLFAEWLYRKSRIAGTLTAGLLLATSIGAFPFNMVMEATSERTLGPHLFQFAREVHGEYPDAVRSVSEYLLEHADRDDLVYVPKFHYREPLVFYVGHHVRFCCTLDGRSRLPRSRMAALATPLYVGEADPDWVVLFGEFPKGRRQEVEASHRGYEAVAEPNVYHGLTQRPELNYHAFTPLPPATWAAVYVLRRKS